MNQQPTGFRVLPPQYFLGEILESILTVGKEVIQNLGSLIPILTGKHPGQHDHACRPALCPVNYFLDLIFPKLEPVTILQQAFHLIGSKPELPYSDLPHRKPQGQFRQGQPGVPSAGDEEVYKGRGLPEKLRNTCRNPGGTPGVVKVIKVEDHGTAVSPVTPFPQLIAEGSHNQGVLAVNFLNTVKGPPGPLAKAR